MSVPNNLFWNSSSAQEKLAEIQKAQSTFASQYFSQSAELQKKQFDLLTSIVQNHVEFSSQLFSNALKIINDNAVFPEKKAAKDK